MNNETIILCVTAASIGFFHTLFGPDHYLPFVVLRKACGWSAKKTAFVTFLCGVGHILSSVVLGFIGIFFGIALMKLTNFEAFRGNIAAWALIGFGMAYMVWGIHRAIRARPHQHIHLHEEAIVHSHEHNHFGEHAHPHDAKNKKITPWVLFTIFVLGPCEPLIPLLMYPAAQESGIGLVAVTATFGIITISTMLASVLLLSFGIKWISLGRIERFSHALAGGAIFCSGLAIQFLGL